MYDENKLRAEFAAQGTTARQVCHKLGMHERTFYGKMKSGKWSVNEAKAIIKTVGIDPARGTEIFLD